MRASAGCSWALCSHFEQHLDDADVDPALQEVGGETMPKDMHAHVFVKPAGGAADRQAACRTVGSIGLSGAAGEQIRGGRTRRQ